MKGTDSVKVGNITINVMNQEARDLLEKLCAEYEKLHGKDVSETDGYSALYWAVRWSGLIEATK